MALRRATSTKSRAPRLRTVVKPARSVLRAYSVERMASSGRFRRRPSTASLYQFSPDSPVMWTCASMKPGRSVASPRSTTFAPGGTGRPLPTALIVAPSTTTTAFAVVESPLPSKSRAARRTVTSGGGAGVWAPTAGAARQAATVSRRKRMVSGTSLKARHPIRRGGASGRAKCLVESRPFLLRLPMRSCPPARLLVFLAVLLPAATTLRAADEPRPLTVDDLFALKTVADPQLSPDGQWVAYTVTWLDAGEDRQQTDVWLAPISGGEATRLTTGPKSASKPRFSPDGRWIAYLTSPREGKGNGARQVFLLPRAGGEPTTLTSFLGGVSDVAWAPDGRRLELLVGDADADEAEPTDAEKSPRPIVTRRLQFMRDTVGYLKDQRTHVHVFDVEKKTSFALTSGPFDDSAPAWSPDGEWIAFVSN